MPSNSCPASAPGRLAAAGKPARLILAAATVAGSLAWPAPAGAIELLDRLLSGFGMGNAATLAANGAGKDAPPFRVALLLPYNRDWRRAADSTARGWAVAIRMGDGFVADRPIEIVTGDTDGTAEAAIAAARAASERGPIDVFAGGLAPEAARALAAFARQREQAVVIAGALAGPMEKNHACNAYVARTSFSPEAYQRSAGRFLARRIDTVMTMAPNERGAQHAVGAFVHAYRAGGGRVIEQVWTPPGERYDFAGWLSRARVSGPRMIYAMYAGRAARRVVQQYAKTGLRGSATLMGPAWLYGPDTLSRRPERSVGGRFLATHLPSIGDAPNRSFVAAYRKAFGEAPDLYAFLGYENALAVLLTAAELDGRPRDAKRFIATMRGLSYDGVMPRGDFSFDETGTARLGRLYWTEIRGSGDGELSLARLATVEVKDPGGSCSPTG